MEEMIPVAASSSTLPGPTNPLTANLSLLELMKCDLQSNQPAIPNGEAQPMDNITMAALVCSESGSLPSKINDSASQHPDMQAQVTIPLQQWGIGVSVSDELPAGETQSGSYTHGDSTSAIAITTTLLPGPEVIDSIVPAVADPSSLDHPEITENSNQHLTPISENGSNLDQPMQMITSGLADVEKTIVTLKKRKSRKATNPHKANTKPPKVKKLRLHLVRQDDEQHDQDDAMGDNSPHLKNKDIICAVEGCNTKFQFMSQLKKHSIIHSGLRPFQCTYQGCEKSFRSKHHLVKHAQRHENKKLYKCEELNCERTFSTSNRLEKHIKCKHSNPQDPESTCCLCPDCGKIFRSKKGLYEHKLHHGSARNYLCKVCGKGFKTKSNLNNHMRGHTEVKAYECTVPGCGKRFKRPHILREHQASHSDAKNFMCHGCGKSYKALRHLRRHERKAHKRLSVLVSSVDEDEAMVDEQVTEPVPESTLPVALESTQTTAPTMYSLSGLDGTIFQNNTYDSLFRPQNFLPAGYVYNEQQAYNSSCLFGGAPALGNPGMNLQWSYQYTGMGSLQNPAFTSEVVSLQQPINDSLPLVNNIDIIQETGTNTEPQCDENTSQNQSQQNPRLLFPPPIISDKQPENNPPVTETQEPTQNPASLESENQLQAPDSPHLESSTADLNPPPSEVQMAASHAKINLPIAIKQEQPQEPESEAEENDFEGYPSSDEAEPHEDKTKDPTYKARIKKTAKEILREQFVCAMAGCEMNFTSLHKLQRHMACGFHKPYTCQVADCRLVFKHLNSLRTHAAIHATERAFVCLVDNCGKSFTRSSVLKRHIVNQHRGSPYVCEEENCSETFKDKKSLRLHITENHQPPENHPFPCTHDGCDKTFKFKDHLQNHISVQHGKKGFSCRVEGCVEMFSSRQDLVEHLSDDHPVLLGKTFVCNMDGCGKAFKYRKSLLEHEKHHSNDRPQICQTCGKTFKTKSNLNNHIRGHTVEKAYVCSVLGCEKRFKRPHILREHLSSCHSDGNMFLCQICGRSYKAQRHLRRHQKKFHADEYTSLRTTGLIRTMNGEVDIQNSEAAAEQYHNTSLVNQVINESTINTPSIIEGGGTDSLILICPVEGCGVSFIHQRELSDHMVLHTGSFPQLLPMTDFGC